MLFPDCPDFFHGCKFNSSGSGAMPDSGRGSNIRRNTTNTSNRWLPDCVWLHNLDCGLCRFQAIDDVSHFEARPSPDALALSRSQSSCIEYSYDAPGWDRRPFGIAEGCMGLAVSARGACTAPRGPYPSDFTPSRYCLMGKNWFHMF